MKDKMKKTIFQYSIRGFLLISLLTLSLVGVAQQKEVTIYHTNDTHSRIDPVDVNSSDRNAGLGGFVRRATCLDSLRTVTPDLLLFDCGDFCQGTPYYNLYKGEVEVKLMNLMKYDAVAIGNHEFDFGLENMEKLFKLAEFPIVCANYDFKGTILESLVKPYVILERNGLKIGVFGLSPRLEGLVQAAHYGDVVYNDPIKVADEIAHELKVEQKCDLVICLSHLGLRPSALYRESDQVLVRETSNIDVVLGGHSHAFMDEPEIVLNTEGQGVPITQMGKNGVFLGKLKLTLDEVKK